MAGDVDHPDSAFAPVWLRRAYALFRRRVLLVVSAALIGVALAALLAAAGPPRFQSAVLIELADGAGAPGQQVPPLSAFTTGNGGAPEISTEVLRAVVRGEKRAQGDILRRQPDSWLGARVKRLISALPETLSGADPDPPLDPADGRDSTEMELIRALRNATDVSMADARNIVEFTVTAGTPNTAQRFAAALGDAFIAERDRRKKARLAAQTRQHDERLAELQSEVDGAERALADYLAENDLESLETRSTQSDLRAANLNFEIVRLEAELARLQSARDRIRTAVAQQQDLGALPEIQSSDLSAALRGERLALQRTLRDMQGGDAAAAEIAALDRQIAALDADILAEAQRIVASLDSEISAVETRNAQLRSALSDLVAEAETIQTALMGVDELQRQVDASRDAYLAFLSGYDPNGISDAGFVSDAWVLQPASRPMQPVKAPLAAIALAGGLAGALVGMVLAGIRERFVRGFVAAGQIEKVLGLPVLISLPRARPRNRHWFRKSKQRWQDLPLRAREDLRGLRHLLTGQLAAKSAPVVLLTSAGPEEGRTGFAMTLARSANQDRRSVLLVDADPKNARLSKAFDCASEDGLTELVQDATWELERNVPGSGVMDVLPAGRVRDAPLRFIESPIFARFLDEARDHYDLILIDGPSNMTSLETRVLAGLSDATCLVVRWNFTPRRDIADAVERLGRKLFLGVAFTDVDMRKSALYRATYPLRKDVAAAGAGLTRRAALPTPASFARASGHA